jgi:hypothetical protein
MSDTLTALGGDTQPAATAAALGVQRVPQQDDAFTQAKLRREHGENASRDPNAQNPHSSAGGADQIIDGTWSMLMNKYHPELARTMSPEALLSLKSDPQLSEEMAGRYDRDNGRFLASKGMPVTPQTLNAAYRLGPEGARAALELARTNPDAPLVQAAPDAGSAGNGDIASLTVSQFLANPYPGRGAGGGAAAVLQSNLARTAREGNETLSRMQTQFDRDSARVEGMMKDYKPVEVAKPPEQPHPDPLHEFGSLASIFVGLASAFSRTPAVAAMNGMAAAITSANNADWKSFDTSYNTWKDNTKLQIEAQNRHSADMRDALDVLKTNASAGHAMLQSIFAQANDTNSMALLAQGNTDLIAQQHAALERTTQQIQESAPVAFAATQYRAAQVNLQKAEEGKDPATIDAARKLVDTARGQFEEAERARYGGTRGGAGSGDASAMDAAIRAQHPDWGADQVIAERVKRLAAAKQSGQEAVTPSTPQERESAAAQIATGQPAIQVVPGFGKAGIAARKQARADAIDMIMKQHPGMSAADAGVQLANASIEYQSGKKSAGQLTTMLGATRAAVKQLDFNIGLAKREMAKLPSTDLSPVINAIARGEQRWTGDPAYQGLFFAMHAVAMESARILSGGQASVAQLNEGARAEADKWANANMTPASFEEVAGLMHEEGENRIDNFESSLKEQRVGGTSETKSGPTPGWKIELVH